MVKAQELSHLAATWTASLVEVDGMGVFHVKPPSVQVALSVYALLPAAAGGSEPDSEALRRLVMDWLPLRLATALFAREQSWTKRAELLMALLTAGLSNEQATKGQLGEVEEKARTRSWTSVLAEYATVYHTDPRLEPWAYFLQRCSVLDEVRARAEVSQMTWYGAARSAKPDPVLVRAGMKDPPEEVEEPAFMRDPAWKEKQLQKIQALREKRGLA